MKIRLLVIALLASLALPVMAASNTPAGEKAAQQPIWHWDSEAVLNEPAQEVETIPAEVAQAEKDVADSNDTNGIGW